MYGLRLRAKKLQAVVGPAFALSGGALAGAGSTGSSNGRSGTSKFSLASFSIVYSDSGAGWLVANVCPCSVSCQCPRRRLREKPARFKRSCTHPARFL